MSTTALSRRALLEAAAGDHSSSRRRSDGSWANWSGSQTSHPKTRLTLGAGELAPLYPRWDAFRAVRRRLDPTGKFLNAHLRHCLGEA